MKSEYAELYNLPEWQKKRLEILQLKEWKCEICGEKKYQLNVHHRYYIPCRKPWEYDNNELAVLCDFCHKREHDFKKGIFHLFDKKLNEIRKLGCSDNAIYSVLSGIDWGIIANISKDESDRLSEFYKSVQSDNEE